MSPERQTKTRSRVLWTLLLAFAVLLVGCVDRSLSLAQQARLDQRMADCNYAASVPGVSAGKVDACRQNLSGPETGNPHTVLLGPMGIGGTFTWYDPN